MSRDKKKNPKQNKTKNIFPKDLTWTWILFPQPQLSPYGGIQIECRILGTSLYPYFTLCMAKLLSIQQ